MNNQKIIKRAFLFIIIASAGLVLFLIAFKKPNNFSSTVSSPNRAETSVDYQASFAIFVHGTFRVFTAAMYHNLSPDVFIKADNPNIIHVKKSGVTWDDFFKTLPFKLTSSCLTTGTGETFCTGQGGTLKFYLNGIRDDALLERIINPGDRALITFGNETDPQIQIQLEKVAAIK